MSKKTVIFFKGKACPQCKNVEKIFNEATRHYKDSIEIKIIDITEDIETAVKNQILSIPTIVFTKDNKEVTRVAGAVSKEKIEELIRKLDG